MLTHYSDDCLMSSKRFWGHASKWQYFHNVLCLLELTSMPYTQTILKNIFKDTVKKKKKENKTTTKFDKIYCNFSKDIQLSRLSPS